ncbi:MAG: chorismate-binding protein [Mariprofundaceae bacterium]|nr:chorismate-binding protein [Mariprofundaceae bacterium]
MPSGINIHDIFQSQPDKFAALLEDPNQQGRQILVAAKGYSQAFSLTDLDALTQWRASLPTVSKHGFGISQVFYIAYEAVHWLETMPQPRISPHNNIPILYIHQPEWSLCLDHQQGLIYIAAKQYASLDYLAHMIANVKPHILKNNAPNLHQACALKSDYCKHVEKVKAYIRAGDVFQVNIARFWKMPYLAHQLPELYASLRQKNPAPFSSFFRAGALTLVCSSPERLFQITSDGWLNTRPIAGTRPRGEGEHDQAFSRALLLSEKEQAEHIMLVDLERNDLGRVCQIASIEVNERMVIERYATVQHIVSNVRGRLQGGLDIVDVFCALFPGGTITGCPKIRSMEIIHELEPQARAAYTGTLGYIASDGSCDSNIIIRSFWHENDTLHWAAGAGIVADSVAEQELEETEHKVKGLLRALY